MHVTTLGPLALDGRPVRGERLSAVVRELVAARGRAVSVGALVEAVWDGAPPDDEQGAVQALVSRVRRLGLRVETLPGGYRLPSDDLTVDADEARALVGAARAALDADDLAAAAEHARRARALLPAAPDDVAAVRLLAETADVAARVALRAGGPYDESDLRQLATRTPPDEPSVALLVRVLAAQGRDAEALEVVESLRRDLAERYGTDPSPVVAHAHVALLRGELGPTSAPATSSSPTATPLAAGHTPARPASSPLAHLPSAWRRPPTPLVGRDADVAAVTAALQEAPVVTVVATGGAGKTRLAAEVARGVAQAGQQVRVVELAGLRSADDVLPAVLGELGGSETVPTLPEVNAERRVLPRRDRLRAAAQNLSGLVVLDNCEHVLAEAASVVADLLEVVPPDVTVLATSRAPLGLVGERVHRLLALPDDDALALLRARAQAARPGMVWDDEQALALCHRLDNLPLALELAAARLRSMPVQDLLDGLTDRFTLLDDALRGLPERHASLWALVDWSRDLLPDDERALLERLAVVPGSFTAALAASIAGVPDARRGLADLVDQSLLVLDDTGSGPARYRMLETVREYGDARLEASGHRDDAMAGLVAWATREAVDLADRMFGPGQLAALARCSDEQESLVAALRWALEHDEEPSAVQVAAALFQWWTVRGMHVEVVTWASRLVHVDDPAARRRSALFVGAASGRPLPHGDLATSVMLQTAVNGGITSTLRLPSLAGRVLRRLMREQADEISPGAAALAQAVPTLASNDLEALEALRRGARRARRRAHARARAVPARSGAGEQRRAGRVRAGRA
ncbi:AfsR/SARP family transcriptional regulator [Cellulomonas persica]